MFSLEKTRLQGDLKEFSMCSDECQVKGNNHFTLSSASTPADAAQCAVSRHYYQGTLLVHA